MNKDKLDNFLNTSRITAREILDDAREFLEQEYEQRGKVFNRSSPYGMILRVLSSLVNLVFFYLEDAMVESNILTARRQDTVRGFASLTGHQPHTRSAASGVLSFSFNLGAGDDITGKRLTIPNGMVLRNDDNGLKYTLRLSEDAVTLPVNGVRTASFSAPVVQGEYAENAFVSDGSKLQTFSIDESAVDADNVSVTVNGEQCTIYKSLYDMQPNGHSCLIRSNFDDGVAIIFGNGSFGKIPPKGAEVRARYLKTNGSNGDVSESKNWTIETPGSDALGNEVDLNDKYSVRVEEPVIFGDDVESIEFTRLMAPHKSMTFSLVNKDDYVTFLSRYNYFSIVEAFTARNGNESEINLLLVPNLRKQITGDSDYFSLPEGGFQLGDYEKSKLLRFLALNGGQAPNTDVDIIDPNIKRYAIDVIVRGFRDEEEHVVERIREMTSEYFLTTNRQDYIPSSDLVYLYEKIDGLDSVNVFFVSEEYEKMRSAGGNHEEDNTPGLDRMNDIKIGPKELPVIRGGWYDRFGQEYEKSSVRSFAYKDVMESNDPMLKGALNIYFQPSIKRDASAQILENNIRNIE